MLQASERVLLQYRGIVAVASVLLVVVCVCAKAAASRVTHIHCNASRKRDTTLQPLTAMNYYADYSSDLRVPIHSTRGDHHGD